MEDIRAVLPPSAASSRPAAWVVCIHVTAPEYNAQTLLAYQERGVTMYTLLLVVLAAAYADGTDVETRYANMQQEQLKKQIDVARKQIGAFEKQRKGMEAQRTFGRGSDPSTLFDAKIRLWKQFIDRYEENPSLYVPKLVLGIGTKGVGQIGTLEFSDRFLSDEYGRHDFELVEVLDAATMVVMIGDLHVCVNRVSTDGVKVSSRITLNQVFEIVGEKDWKQRKIVEVRPVDILLSEEQRRIRDEEWKARAKEAKYRVWTEKFPRDLRYMGALGQTFVYEGEYVGEAEAPVFKMRGVKIRERNGPEWVLFYDLLTNEDRVYVEEQKKKAASKENQ